MKKKNEMGYIKEFFNKFYTYLCDKYNISIKASLMTNLEYYRKELIRVPRHGLNGRLFIPNKSLGYYDYINDEIVIFLKKELCNDNSIPIILHALSHEFRHKLQIEEEQSVFNIFIYYIENIISYYERKYYIKDHDLFYMEIDADQWGLEELNKYDKNIFEEYYESFNNKIEERKKLYNASNMFDIFNDIIPKVSKNYTSLWELADISLEGYSKKNREKVINVMSSLYNYNGECYVNAYNILDVDEDIRTIITHSNSYKSI